METDEAIRKIVQGGIYHAQQADDALTGYLQKPDNSLATAHALTALALFASAFATAAMEEGT